MALRTYNDFVSRVAAGFWRSQPIWAELNAAGTVVLANNAFVGMHSAGDTQLMPGSLPSGVTAFIPTSLSQHSQQSTGNALLVAKVINLGSLDISTPTFTDGVAMPNTLAGGGVAMQLGNSNVQSYSGVIVEVKTALNATPGSLSVTYNNQAGVSHTSITQAMTASASVRSCGWLNLAATDWGVTDITAATRTGGTTPTGVLKFWGLIPLALTMTGIGGAAGVDFSIAENLLSTMVNPVRLGINDDINCYLFGSTATKALSGEIFLVGDN